MVGARTRSRRSSAVDPSCWSSSRQRLTGMTCRCHSLLAWSQGQSPPNRFSRRRNTAKIRFGWPAAGEVPDPPAVVADPRTWKCYGLVPGDHPPRRVFLSHTSELRLFPSERSFVAAA